MKIENYSFGEIIIDGKDHTGDLWIINGKIERRNKNISRRKFQTSHQVSREEVKRVVTEKTKRFIVGTGASGLLSIEEEGIKYLEDKGIALEMHKSGELAEMKMEFGEKDSGIIHVTC